MKRPGVDGDFIICFLFNLIMNAFWAIPAVVLFIAHFVAGTPLWLGWAALAIWIVVVFGITAFMSWAVSSGNPAEKRSNATVRYSSQYRNRANSQVQNSSEQDK